MNRKSFIKNSLMSLAIAMLPKILRPMDGEIVETNEAIPEWAEYYTLDGIEYHNIKGFNVEFHHYTYKQSL